MSPICCARTLWTLVSGVSFLKRSALQKWSFEHYKNRSYALMNEKYPLSLAQVCTEGARVATCLEGPKTCFVGCCCFPCTMNEIDGNRFTECSAKCCLRSSDNAQVWVMDQWQSRDTEREWHPDPVVQPGFWTCVLGACCMQCLAAKVAKENHKSAKMLQQRTETAAAVTEQPTSTNQDLYF